jgi:hypothetical protein
MESGAGADMTEVAGAEVLERIREYRIAARKIVEADHVNFKDRCLGLLELVDLARAENDVLIVRWAELSIWAEARGFLGIHDEAPALPPEPFEDRQRRLRQDGYERCPHCFSQIATEEELKRWWSLRRAEAERRDIHERAIG